MDITFTSKFQSRTPVQVVGEFTKAIQPTAEDLKEVGDWLLKRIRERTLSGLDVSGEPFAPYSPRYAKEKGSSQVNLYSARQASKSLQMDLFEHGAAHMLDSLQDKVGDSSTGGPVLEVGIIDSPALSRRARFLQEGWQPRGHIGRRYKKGKMKGKFRRRPPAVPPREWLGADDDDKKEMRNILEEVIATRLGKVGG